MKSIKLAGFVISLTLGVCGVSIPAQAAEIDSILLGNAESEKAHAFSDEGTSRVDLGATGVACRRILKPAIARWRSGPMKFTLKVSPKEATYLTCRLWGGDVSHDHLIMTIDGKMLGQMHLGEYDILDYESCYPRDANRETSDAEHFGVFTYRTFLLPEALTKGKESIEVAVYATGHVWGYGQNFEQFQKNVLHDSRGIYAFTTHTGTIGGLVRMTKAVKAPSIIPDEKKEPDLAGLEKKVNGHLKWLMTCGQLEKGARDDDIGFLAEAYHIDWTVAYHNPEAVKVVVAAVDAQVRKERENPGSVIPRGTWQAGGQAAIGVVRLGAEVIAPFLQEGNRRAEWRDFFLKSVNQLTTERRYFANQSQIVDTNGHICNRALKMCDPKAGPALALTLNNVKEAMGLKPMPNGYVTLTLTGLSKEDGYVGSYGESTIWAAGNAVEASEGDSELMAQLVKASKARLYMRYPGVRRDGRRVARLEAQVSWRNEHFPPPPTYLTNSLNIRNALLSKSAMLVGAVKDMYEDGVLAEYVAEARGNNLYSLRFPNDWRKIKKVIDKAGNSLPHLPMYGEDFVWGDSEDAIVVVKHGEEMLFVEAYWRARGGINSLAKVHYVRPQVEISATVAMEPTYTNPDGKAERIGNWFQYGWQGRLYREGYGDEEGWPPVNALAGAERPHAKNKGRAEFYVVRYGSYIVAINDSIENKSNTLEKPQKGEWVVLPAKTKLRNKDLIVPPKSYLVIRKDS